MVLDSEHEYDICPICFWEDDFTQFEEPYCDGGANHISLYEAQANYRHFGACDMKSIDKVRKPSVYDIKDEDWLPLENICKKFLRWLNENEEAFNNAGIIIEEIKFVEDNILELPTVTVYHHKPDSLIGIITVREDNRLSVEIQNYLEGKTILLESKKLEHKPEFKEILNRYLYEMGVY
jgi:hypothetical protein